MTLHINNVLLQRKGTKTNTILIALGTNLGFIKEVCIIPYLFGSKDLPHWGLAKSLTSIMPKLFHVLQNIIPREVPITLEEEDKETVELFWAGKPCQVWHTAYEEKYNLPLTFQPIDKDGWEILGWIKIIPFHQDEHMCHNKSKRSPSSSTARFSFSNEW